MLLDTNLDGKGIFPVEIQVIWITGLRNDSKNLR